MRTSFYLQIRISTINSGEKFIIFWYIFYHNIAVSRFLSTDINFTGKKGSSSENDDRSDGTFPFWFIVILTLHNSRSTKINQDYFKSTTIIQYHPISAYINQDQQRLPNIYLSTWQHRYQAKWTNASFWNSAVIWKISLWQPKIG